MTVGLDDQGLGQLPVQVDTGLEPEIGIAERLGQHTLTQEGLIGMPHFMHKCYR